ncbi:MAG: bacteriocin [Bacteroides sp.]|nr:bacteriocin [Bacteroides sp.]
MKTNDFSAFQLSKKELNQITGGADFKCQCNGVGTFTVYDLKETENLGKLIIKHCENGGACEAI